MTTRLALAALLCAALSLLSVSPALAATYYVSAAGSDSAAGTSEGTAWQSIDKLNMMAGTLHAGDSVLFRRGDTFYGSIAVSVSGVDGSPITYGAYGTGAQPIISGFSALTSWTDEGGGVYSASLPNHPAALNSVVIDERLQGRGRYPRASDANGGYLAFENHSSTSVIDNELTSSPNFAGGELVVRLRRWVLARAPITMHSGTTLTFSPNDVLERYALQNGSGYYIQNHPATLTEDGDWYYDATAGVMHMRGSASPSGVRAATRDTLFSATGRNYISVTDLAFEGSNAAAFSFENGSNLRVENCSFRFAGEHAALISNTSHVNFNNNSLRDSVSNGVEFRGSGASDYTIRGNSFVDTGVISGMGQGDDGISYQALQFRLSSGAVVEYNTFTNTGFIPIAFYGNDILIKNNVIDHYCYIKDDGGAIYTWNGGNPVTQYSNRVITGNIISGGVGLGAGTSSGEPDVEGIYLDNNSNHVDVTNNTVFGITASGFYANSLQDATISGNTFYDNGQSFALTRYVNDGSNPVNGGQDIMNVTVRDNVMFARRDTQFIFAYSDFDLNFPSAATLQDRLQAIGTIDENFHAQPNPFSFDYSYTADGTTVFPLPVSFLTWKNWTSYDEATTVMAPLPTYDVHALISANLATNGDFETNIDNVGAYSGDDNHTIAWDAGSLRLTVTEPGLRAFTLLYAGIGPVDSAKKYLLRFSTRSTNDDGRVRVAMRYTGGTHETITPYQVRAFGRDRVDHEMLFVAPTTTEAASWEFGILQTDGDVFIDDIAVYEVDADTIDPDRYLRFEINTTNADRVVSLDANYVDARGFHYETSLTLPPYSSLVLVRTDGPGPVLPDGGMTDGGGPAYDAGVMPRDGSTPFPDAQVASDAQVLAEPGLSSSCQCNAPGARPHAWGWLALVAAFAAAASVRLRRKMR